MSHNIIWIILTNIVLYSTLYFGVNFGNFLLFTLVLLKWKFICTESPLYLKAPLTELAAISVTPTTTGRNQ